MFLGSALRPLRALVKRKLMAVIVSFAMGAAGLGWLTDSVLLTQADASKVAKELGADPVGNLSEVVARVKADMTGHATVSDYDRSAFGSWKDFDGDCQNTRHEMLISQAQESPFMSSDNCHVLSGLWKDPYSGQIFNDPKKLDVDHIVPLKWAHDAGASAWSREQKKRFANDPRNLLVVSAKLNRQKGAFGPENWMPPNSEYRCDYVLTFYKLARSYDLLSPDDAISLRKMRTRECR